jgi:hypothetical protein
MTVVAATIAGTGAVVAQSAADAAPHAAGHSAASSKTERILITAGPGDKQIAVVHGPITGGGRDSAGGQKDVLHLGSGSLTLEHPDKQSTFKITSLNRKTCFAAFTIKGKYTLIHGTGQYAGASGHGRYLVRGNDILRRTSSGTCSTKGQPQAEAFLIKASGPASLPSN